MLAEILHTIGVRTLLVGLVTLLASRWFLGRHKNLPPGPWALPIVGNIPLMIKIRREKKLLFQGFMELYRKYGPVFRLWTGPQLTVVLNDPEVIREAFVKQADIFSMRPNWMFLTKLITKQKGIIMHNDEAWKETRRFVLTALRDFGLGKTSLEDKIHEEIRTVMEEFHSYQGKPFDPILLMNNAVSNVICSICFGKRFDYDDEFFKKMLKNVQYCLRNSNQGIMTNVFPFLLRIPFIEKGIKEVVKKFQEISYFIEDQITEHEQTFDPTNIRDLLDLGLHRAAEEGADNPVFDRENLVVAVRDLFFAGTETTSTALNWSFLYMITQPEVQSRCQQEIDTVIGRGRLPSLSDRKNLPYVEATILEVQRLSNVAPIAVPHSTNQATKLRGYNIPKHTIIWSNIAACHLDPRHWEDPLTFCPDRWLDNQGQVKKVDNFIPFSIGPRVCLGESLAKMELFLFFSAILQQFTLRKEEGVEPEVVGIVGITHAPKPFRMQVEYR